MQRGWTAWRQVVRALACVALAGGLRQIQAADTLPSVPPVTQTASTQPAAVALNPAILTDEQVVAAMKSGINYLLSTERGDNWESGWPWMRNGQHGGETALVLYALLHAGQSLKDDPEFGPKLNYRGKDLGPAVDWLVKVNPEETYTAALQANALALLPQKPDEKPGQGPHAAMQRAYRYLLTAMGTQGGYTYGPPGAFTGRGRGPFGGGRGGGGRGGGLMGVPGSPQFGDLSNAQYGALGMWALEDAGFDAPANYWQLTDRFWRLLQRPSGSWPYYAAGNFRGEVERDSMGIAGIATLYIAQEFVDKSLRSIPKVDRNIDLGLAWLNQNFTPDFGDLYSMYSIERVGLASGLKYFGTKDWYRLLAANIISHQHPDGSWDAASWADAYKSFNGATATTCTSYALLFLARGRNPVLFNKLEYEGAGGQWNARPRDDAFLTRWMSKQYERPLNWQIVNMDVDPTQWLDAPILLITGSRDPKFTPDDIAKLRTFIEAGGMIFSTSDESSTVFTEAMRRYAGEVVKGRYEMRILPRTDMLYSAELGADMTNAPGLLAMNDGIRDIWVHCPVDLGASWELQRFGNKPHFEVPSALYFYATGKMPLKARLKTLAIADPAVVPTRKVALARVTYGGNADPEPGAWPRLAKILRSSPAPLDMTPTLVGIDALDASKYPVAHMTGTARFLVKDADCLVLRQYLDAGGMLMADAGGGSKAFADSFKEMMARVYPDARFLPLPPDHPVYTGAFAGGKGENIGEVDFRKYGVVALGQRITQPDIQALVVNGRTRVLFSQYDITSGLLGSTTWGIVGYLPDSAVKLAGNMVRFAMEQESNK